MAYNICVVVAATIPINWKYKNEICSTLYRKPRIKNFNALQNLTIFYFPILKHHTMRLIFETKIGEKTRYKGEISVKG